MSVRMNITLEDNLKERMDRADKKEISNWSVVAAAAFEMRLAEIEDRKVEKKMEAAMQQLGVSKAEDLVEEAIERLRASKLEAEEEDMKSGHECGRQWAREKAEWKELLRLDQAKERCGNEFGVVFYGDRGGIGFFQQTVDPDENTDWKNFWETWSGSHDDPSGEFVLGFWEGAVELLYEAQSKIT